MSNQPTSSSDPQTVIPLAEDQVQVGRAVVEQAVRVRTVTREHEHLVTAALLEEQVEIERVRVDREVAEAPAVRVEDGVTIVPILEEIAVVETRLVLREELHIRKRAATTEARIPVRLRRQEAEIERPDDDTSHHTQSGKG